MTSDAPGRPGRKGRTAAAREQRAIAALLTNRTVRDAAGASGISERVLYRLLARDDFRAQLRDASRRHLDDALAQLRATTRDAVATLRDALTCDHDGTRVRAALGLLQHALQSDLDDIRARLDALEAQPPKGHAP